MKLSRASTYALYGLAYIAGQEGERYVPLSEIHEKRGVPEKHLAKIFQTLVKAGLLVSARGVRGGFSLARSPEAISPLDVIEAIEGRIPDSGCMLLIEECDRDTVCRINSVWRRAQNEMLTVLRSTTIADLIGRSPEDLRPPVVKLGEKTPSGPTPSAGTNGQSA